MTRKKISIRTHFLTFLENSHGASNCKSTKDTPSLCHICVKQPGQPDNYTWSDNLYNYSHFVITSVYLNKYQPTRTYLLVCNELNSVMIYG